MNTLRNLGAAPGPTLASFGQRYQDLPPATFDQRFGPYQAPGPTPDARDQLRRLMEEQMLRNTPEGIVPGQRTWPYGYIQTQAPTLQRMASNDVTDRGIPTPQYVRPTPEEEIPSNFRMLQGGPKRNMPSQEEIDATVRLNQQQYEEYLRGRR